MIGIVVLVVIGLVLLFPVVMTRLTKREPGRIERAGASAAGHEARLGEEERAAAGDHGLVPEPDLVLDGEPGPEEAAALDAAKAGDWRPAAAYLAVDAPADVRWRRQRSLTELAGEEDDWLRAWRAERPQDPTAALVHADAMVVLAWNVRSSARAKDVSREQFAAFHRILRQAEEAAAEAVGLAPDDPNPWVAQIPMAMGLGWSHERFRAHWAELTARDPHHWAAHNRALQYWCAKWHGSHELMHGFVDGAIAAAPAGSLLTPMKLEAYWEQFGQDGERLTAWQRPEVRAAQEAVRADLAAADPDHPRIRTAHGWLAYTLTVGGRPNEAIEHYRALGRYVPQPFTYFNDPRATFVSLRGKVAKRAKKA